LTDFERLLAVLSESGVEFILVGGLAANAHGAIRTTRDIDVVYARSRENLTRIERALGPWSPRLRGAPPGLPFRLDAPTLAAGLNFTLSTDLGDLDLLGEVTGGGSYEVLSAHARPVELLGSRLLCLDLETLIAVKRAAGRPKDLEAVAELEALKEERDARERSAAD
jgi:predicted nucleotidyltransferase